MPGRNIHSHGEDHGKGCGSLWSGDTGCLCTGDLLYTYDDLQRKIQESVNYGTFTKSYNYAYYANGTKKTFTGPDGNAINYTYDQNNRISGIQIPGQGQITWNTYQWNSPTKRTLPGGSTTDYTYDPLMRINAITAKDPGQNALMTRNYDYSQAGNIASKETEHGSYTYQYDNLYRLTDAANPTQPNETYTYDALGNRITSAQITGEWTYNANNELQSYDGTSLEYDANGNTIKKTVGTTVTSYVYNIEDRLTEVWNGEVGSGSLTATYYYDPFGRRLWKEVDGVRVYFLYSDEGLIGEYDAAGTALRTYGYAPDSNWTTDPLFQESAGAYYWYQNDHLGTPQKITTTSGAVAWAGTYDSFGNVQIDTAGITNNLRLAGQYYDAETGLYYNLNRYYDPATGRYLRADPQGDGLNLYAYCYNSPIIWIDPEGLCVVHPILAAGGLIPAFGIVPDLLDAAFYVLEGDWEGAGYSGMAAIPIFGQGARGVQYAKIGKKLIKPLGNEIGAVGNVSKLSRKIDRKSIEESKRHYKQSRKYKQPKQEDPVKDNMPDESPTAEQINKREPLWAKAWRVMFGHTDTSDLELK